MICDGTVMTICVPKWSLQLPIKNILVPSFIGRKPGPKTPHSLLNYVLTIVLLLTTALLSKQYSSVAYPSLTFPRSPAKYHTPYQLSLLYPLHSSCVPYPRAEHLSYSPTALLVLSIELLIYS